MSQLTYEETTQIPAEQLLSLYESVGWSAYTQHPQSAAAALAASDWACAVWVDDTLVGLVRVISDDRFIAWVQDILVHPDHQRKGIGRELMSRALRRYEHVRKFVLLTDDEPRQQAFYEAMGFNRMESASDRLRCFVRLG